MKFEVGDNAVHPAHGVGEVTSIEEREIAAEIQRFYVLKIHENGTKVMVAIDSAKKMGLRKPISRNDAKKVIESLRSKKIAVTSQPWNRRQREYNEMLNSGSPFEVAKVLRDLYRLRGEKELSFGERQLYERALARVVSEIAIARKVAESKIQGEIEEILSA